MTREMRWGAVDLLHAGLAIAVLLLAPVGPKPPNEGARPPAAAEETSAELMALGYLDHSPEKAERSKMGVTRYEPDRVQPGYTLITLFGACTAQLLTPTGEAVHSWSASDCEYWGQTTLLDNGDILVTGVDRVHGRGLPFDRRRFLLRMDWQGELRWKRRLMTHHEAIERADHSLMALTLQDRLIPSLNPRRDIQDNFLTTLSPDGAVREQLSLYGALAAGGFPFLSVATANEHGLRHVDLFHANSLSVVARPELAGKHPLYTPGNLLLSLRHQNALVVIDPRQRKAIWWWGQDTLSGPHDVTMLADGHLLVFDNGLNRGWSRVIELEPITGEVVWSWRATAPDRLFTAGRGSSERLKNGNTLVCESERGRVLEVTRDGDIVWEYWVPKLSAQGHRATLGRARRYDAAQLEPWLQPHD